METVKAILDRQTKQIFMAVLNSKHLDHIICVCGYITVYAQRLSRTPIILRTHSVKTSVLQECPPQRISFSNTSLFGLSVSQLKMLPKPPYCGSCPYTTKRKSFSLLWICMCFYGLLLVARSAVCTAQVYSHGWIQWKQFAAPINPSTGTFHSTRGGLVNGAVRLSTGPQHIFSKTASFTEASGLCYLVWSSIFWPMNY